MLGPRRRLDRRTPSRWHRRAGKPPGRSHGKSDPPDRRWHAGTQALRRTETVAVTVAGREGWVRRPNLVGALVGKAAALTNAGDPGRGRHRRDFVILAGLLTARDFRGEAVTKKDRRRVRAMVAACGKTRHSCSRFRTQVPRSTAWSRPGSCSDPSRRLDRGRGTKLQSFATVGVRRLEGSDWARFDSQRFAISLRRPQASEAASPQVRDLIGRMAAVCGKGSHPRSGPLTSSR